MKNDLLSIIKNASTWLDVYGELSKQNTGRNPSVGKLFEEFCKCYYLLDPLVKNEYRNAWLFSEIPQDIKTRLNLGKVDHGIDLVLEGVDDTLSVVQCKFRNNQSCNISWTKDNLANLFADGDKADYFIVFTNASGLDKHSLTKKENQLKLVTVGDLLNIPSSTFETIKNHLTGTYNLVVTKKEPREYQFKAIQAVVNGFKQQDRGQLILPCGAGKTLVSLWIKEALNVRHALVLVPSLALLRQIKNEWTINSERFIPYICVCSEKDIDKAADHLAIHTYEISGKVSTNVNEVVSFLRNKNESIVYSTYQSLEVICKAVKELKFEFDLAICDEAHKTSGSKYSKFGLVHLNTNIAVKKRLYMTATPRIISDSLKIKLNDEIIKYIYDMSNSAIFGLEFYRMSFREAIDKQILVDYKIIAVGISDYELEQAISLRRFISDTETIDEIANNYALEKFMKTHGPTHAITFHSSVKKAKDFQNRHAEIYQGISSFHVNGKLTTNERSIRMKEFEKSPLAVMTNARCLTEGVDVPVIDVVYFCDPKNSKIDIVQATGRALRRADHKEKKLGYVVVPIFHRKMEDLDEIIEASPFKNLIEVIKAMCSHDERLVDEIKKIKIGSGRRELSSQHVSIEYCHELITLTGFDEKLKENLFVQTISKVRIPWRDFNEAKKFSHNLKLSSVSEWIAYAKSGDKPADIPVMPYETYKNKGWISWGDWLGTYRLAEKNRVFRSCIKAREFVHGLNLKSSDEWMAYCKKGNRPNDIPSDPRSAYKNDGWVSMGDWLGTYRIADKDRVFRSFIKAREFVHNLNLKSGDEWRAYCKKRSNPDDIPADPRTVYKNDGWISMGDWLGTGKIANRDRKYRPFKEAKKFIHTLCLKGENEWRIYTKSGYKPPDIPGDPAHVYKNQGWNSWGDWLGTGTVALYNRTYISFEEAREFVHNLKLSSQSAWLSYCKSANKPDNIPADPRKIYKTTGWISMGDWLGTGKVAPQDMVYRSFSEAEKFVHVLKLKNEAEWQVFCKGGNKPPDIPSRPNQVYKDNGWVSWGDWLGTYRKADKDRIFRSFIAAREFTHTLKLKNQFDWFEFCKSKNKPDDIPVSPGKTYKNKGWKSWGDWLGTGTVANQNKKYRPFLEALEFVHNLKLKSTREWNSYSKGGGKPNDIPADPRVVYRNIGWTSMGSWLGTGAIAPRNMIYCSFANAKKFVYSLQLKTEQEWRDYCKSGNKPSDIPANPHTVYKTKGWKSMGDWLGTGTVANQNKKYRSFLEARKFVHDLKLKNGASWKAYCKSGSKPSDIPSYPNDTYKNHGWKSMGDWLGTTRN